MIVVIIISLKNGTLFSAYISKPQMEPSWFEINSNSKSKYEHFSWLSLVLFPSIFKLFQQNGS